MANGKKTQDVINSDIFRQIGEVKATAENASRKADSHAVDIAVLKTYMQMLGAIGLASLSGIVWIIVETIA